jgi:hypothetical protein
VSVGVNSAYEACLMWSRLLRIKVSELPLQNCKEVGPIFVD